MRPLSYVFRPRWRLFREYDERLRLRPDPQVAQERFQRRLRLAAKVSMGRIGCYVGLYLSAIATGLSFAWDYVRVLPDVDRGVNLLEATSGLGVVFVLGIVTTGRFLRQLELDMTFLSAESRMPIGRPDPEAQRMTP